MRTKKIKSSNMSILQKPVEILVLHFNFETEYRIIHIIFIIKLKLHKKNPIT